MNIWACDEVAAFFDTDSKYPTSVFFPPPRTRIKGEKKAFFGVQVLVRGKKTTEWQTIGKAAVG